MSVHNPVHKFWGVENNLDILWIICVKKISTYTSVENHTIFPHFLHTEIHNVKLAEIFLSLYFPTGCSLFFIFSTESTVLLLLLYITVLIFILLIT